MTGLRVYLAGILTAITAAVIIHGDPLWLLFMCASDAISLTAGMLIGRVQRVERDAALVRYLHTDAPRSVPSRRR
jgi:hypothetical protein